MKQILVENHEAHELLGSHWMLMLNLLMILLLNLLMKFYALIILVGASTHYGNKSAKNGEGKTKKIS